MKRKSYEFSADLEMNMTPMIDIVFQLITFFMMVSDLSKLEKDQAIVLPHLDKTILDTEAPPDRLIVNITQSGDIKVFGRTLGNRELRAQLKTDADLDRPKGRRQGDILPSNRALVIRADHRTEFQYIEKVLYYCTDPKIRIWQMSFGAGIQE